MGSIPPIIFYNDNISILHPQRMTRSYWLHRLPSQATVQIPRTARGICLSVVVSPVPVIVAPVSLTIGYI